MIIPLALNIYARRLLAPFEILGMVCHKIFLPIFIVVLVCTAPRSSPSFVFTDFITDQSGWTNPGIVFSVGLLTSTYTFTGFDGALHMSEEVKNAHTVVPQAMVFGVLINGVMAWGWMICLLFTMGNVQNALSTPTGYSIMQVVLSLMFCALADRMNSEILYQATGSLNATNTLIAMLMITGYVSLFGSLASVSRLVWAFARDNGLPFSKYFVHVDPKLKVPLRALGLVTMIVFLLSFIQLGSTAAFEGITSLSTLALYASYTLPILFFTIWKLRGKPIDYGPFRMGKLGIIVNFYAIAWGIYTCIFLPFPPSIPVESAASSNWSGPVFGFVLILAVLDWIFSGRKRFVAPTKVLQDE